MILDIKELAELLNNYEIVDSRHEADKVVITLDNGQVIELRISGVYLYNQDTVC